MLCPFELWYRKFYQIKSILKSPFFRLPLRVVEKLIIGTKPTNRKWYLWTIVWIPVGCWCCFLPHIWVLPCTLALSSQYPSWAGTFPSWGRKHYLPCHRTIHPEDNLHTSSSEKVKDDFPFYFQKTFEVWV